MPPQPPPLQWVGPRQIGQVSFTCGFCTKNVGATNGFNSSEGAILVFCPYCGKPTFMYGDQQVPGVAFGVDIANLPKEIEPAYTEARNCMSVSAFTAAAMMARKILMNVAVTLGAKPGEYFKTYVEWLAKNGHVTERSKAWVDHIRDKGNEATHELPQVSKKDAENVLVFVEMLLKTNFEYPNKVP